LIQIMCKADAAARSLRRGHCAGVRSPELAALSCSENGALLVSAVCPDAASVSLAASEKVH